MPKRIAHAFSVSVLLSATLHAVESNAARLTAEAQRILANVKSTEYSHKTSVDEEAGSYKLDCSGLLCLLLKKVAPEALKAIPRAGTEKRPLAHDFYECFRTAPTQANADTRWVRIERLADARPGDVLAWKNENYQPSENTGHVVVLMEAPVQDGEAQYKVAVIDSSSRGHGDDTRKKDESGIGRGTLWFSVNAAGQVTGVRLASKTGTLNTKPIAIGRLTE